jgi:thymidine phosphorylase
VVQEVPAPRAGVVQRCHALGIGRAAARLGAGRARKEDAVDHAVGIVVHRKRGDRVERGEPLATVHARANADLDAVAACFDIADEAAEPSPLVLEMLDA